MKVNSIGPNQTEIVKSNGDTILVSYSTPVAAVTDLGTFRTSKKWSNTTSRHINAWLDGAEAQEKPQEFFDNLL
jgi:hypothetical protein